MSNNLSKKAKSTQAKSATPIDITGLFNIEYEHIFSGFRGVVTAVIIRATGQIQIELQPKCGDDITKYLEAQWFDMKELRGIEEPDAIAEDNDYGTTPDVKE